MVYKLVAREGPDGVLQPVAKASARKPSMAGRKAAARRLDASGRAVEEVVLTGSDHDVATWAPSNGDLRPLHVPLVEHGAVHLVSTAPCSTSGTCSGRRSPLLGAQVATSWSEPVRTTSSTARPDASSRRAAALRPPMLGLRAEAFATGCRTPSGPSRATSL